MFNSLRQRLTIIFIGLAVLPLVIVGGVLAQRTFDTLEQQAEESQTDTAQRVGVEIEAFIRERENELDLLIDVRGLSTLSQDEQESLLRSLMAREQIYQRFALLDSSGQEQLYLSRSEVIMPEDLVSRAEREEFIVPISEETTYFSDVRFDENIREPLITIAMPVIDRRTGEITQILVADLRFRPVWDLLATIDLSGESEVYVTNAAGRVVAHSNPSVVLRETMIDFPGEPGRADGLNDDEVIMATDRLVFGSQALIVVAEEPVSAALALAQEALTIAAVVTVVALVIAIALVVITVRQVVRPIENLSETAKAITGGNLSLRANVQRKDEIGELAQAFNDMTTKLSSSITDLEHNVEELEKAEHEQQRLIRELKDALIFKDQFLATMSHELRTPLNAILGYSGIALMQDMNMHEKVRHMLERIKANSHRLLSLINDILDISRINAGRVEIVSRPVNLKQLASGWHEDFKQQASDKNIGFELDYDPSLPDVIIGDEERISQITSNLLVNAFKFTQEGRVMLSVKHDDSTMIIEVTDTGIGIPETWQHLIFDEFRQVDATSKRKYGGAGLGLSIVKKLCMLMGGNVKVSSKLNEGSTFTVTLPIQPAEEQASEVSEKEKAAQL